ncbi:lipocalin-like domain-containing protein [Kiloniella sp.]|uniref:lipocalin-like domain-containing protein n=1 Tax=Kiloniella sp. TaxID=1938587 RepID=UPI003B010800
MGTINSQNSDVGLAEELIGVWWLLTREDVTADGSQRVDPTLGPNPQGILTYTSNRFAAQFMKRDRSEKMAPEPSTRGVNNTGAIDGYDAYFGTYEVKPSTGEVMHKLEGALDASNVGIEVSRQMNVEGDRLVIRLDTTTPAGEPITRTLTWRRIG